MEVRVERLPQSVAKISVTIDEATVKEATEKAFRKLNSRYNIPGFRRGKAPRALFERYVGREVLLQQAAEDLIQNRYGEVLEQADVDPVTEPRVSIDKIEDGVPFEFSIEVEAKPVIGLPEDYRSAMEGEELPAVEVTEELVAEELQQLASSQGQLVPADEEPVARGNRIVVNVKGYLEGEEADAEPFVEDEAYAMEVGSGNTLEAFEDQLVGLSVGQPAEIKITYPEDYPDSNLAGKPARFEVTVSENKRVEVPPVDDDLATTLGAANLQELKDDVTKNIRRRLEHQARDERFNRILGKLREQTPIELPGALVRSVIQEELQELQQNLSRYGISLDEYLRNRQGGIAGLQEEIRPRAEERVHNELLLEAIAREQGMTVDDQEVVAALAPLAESSKQSVERIVTAFRQGGQFESLRHNLMLGKVTDWLTGANDEATVEGGNAAKEETP